MTFRENNNNITNQAWEKLYSRLEEDGLLTQDHPSDKTGFKLSTLKWVAGIAVLAISIALAMVINRPKPEKVNILTINNENPASLVSTLEDGSVVYLSEYASLQYPDRFQKNKREVFLEGEAFFDITKDKEKPFIIDTEKAIIQVLGTSFNVKSKADKSFSISVKQGEVRVTSKKDNQTVYVKAGETAMFDAGNLLKTQTTDAAQFSAYLTLMHFKDQRLEDVVRIINANNDSIRLEVAPDVKDKLITGTFGNETPHNMAWLISEALKLKLVQQQNTILITN